MKKAIKTGIFGGSFDPPHFGHLKLAQNAMDSLGLDEIFWVVTPIPPHKISKKITAFNHRLAMVYLCVLNESRFTVSDLESRREGPHYTRDTIEIFMQMYPERKFSLLIGGDSLSNFHKWFQPDEIIKNIDQLGVFSRGNKESELGSFREHFPVAESKVKFIDLDPIAISSSDIRQRIAKGFAIEDFLPNTVADYIFRNKLYRSS